MNNYIGKNSRTEFEGVKIKVEATKSIYLFLIACILISISILLFNRNLSGHGKTASNVLGLVIVYIAMNIIGFIIAYIIRIIRSKRVVKYYNNISLDHVCEILINYDYKLWQTAANKSFHPMSFKSPLTNENVKTAIIFTNHSSFGLLPKFKMPEVLQAKNYINNNALVGYDKEHDEWVVIKYKKK